MCGCVCLCGHGREREREREGAYGGGVDLGLEALSSDAHSVFLLTDCFVAFASLLECFCCLTNLLFYLCHWQDSNSRPSSF